MKRSGIPVLYRGVAFLSLCMVGLGLPSSLCAQSTPESEQIKQKVSEYARSVDAADARLAARIWLDSPDVSFIHPLGHEHGFKQIQQNVYQHLMGETFSQRKLSPRDISVHIYRDTAWVEFYWDFVATLKKNDSSITTHGRETQVYWKMEDGWRLVHVHYSGMPVTDQRSGY
jgi:ketosteroid isomerase-like protein